MGLPGDTSLVILFSDQDSGAPIDPDEVGIALRLSVLQVTR
jgi:hypothetical protein